MDDGKLRQDIMDELDFDPSFDARHVTISVDGGVVMVGGYVRNQHDKLAAEKAIRRTHGVKAITGHVEIRPVDHEPHAKLTDDEMAHRAVNVLRWDHSIPDDKIQISVDKGTITLAGEVSWHYQRTAAEEAVRKFCHPRGLENNIVVRPHAQPENIQKLIEDALKRHSAIDHAKVRVSVREGSTVVLEGSVENLDERKAAEDAAWCAMGVEAVDNKLAVVAPKV